MIVLQIDVRGHGADVRWAGAEAVLGSGPGASIRREDAGWAPREAVLVHLGDRLLVVRGDGSGETKLACGESVTLGSARITLVGIAPLAIPADAAEGEREAAPELPRADAPVSRFSTWFPTLGEEAAASSARAHEPEAAEPVPLTPEAATLLFETTSPPRAPRVDLSSRLRPPPAPTPAPTPTLTPPAPPPPLPFDEAPGLRPPVPSAPAAAAATPPPAPAPAVARRRETWQVGTFEDELADALRHSPWFAVSAAVHAALFIVLSLLFSDPPTPPTPQPRHGSLNVFEMATDTMEFGGVDERPDSTLDPEIAKAPELELDPVESVPEPSLDPTPNDPRPATPPVEDAMPERDDAAPPSYVSPAPSVVSVKSGRSKPAPPKPSGVEEEVSHDPDRALEVNRKAAERLRGELRKGGGPLGKALKGLKREDIVVVRGSFDHMEAVLEELRLPYVIVPPSEAAEDYAWQRHKVVFWNCGELLVPPRLRPRLFAALREYVKGGGYLFTTDWAISTIVQPTFPGYVASEGGTKPLPELILDVRPAKGAKNHALLDGVFDDTTSIKWWLENSSFDVRVVDASKVETLVEAPALAGEPWSRDPAVAVTFAHGRGRVLHVMGHYFQQKGTVSGAAGAHRIALNFVRMRLERDAAAGTK